MELLERDLRGHALQVAELLWMSPDEARRICELALELVEWRNRTDPDPEPDQARARTSAQVVSIGAR